MNTGQNQLFSLSSWPATSVGLDLLWSLRGKQVVCSRISLALALSSFNSLACSFKSLSSPLLVHSFIPFPLSTQRLLLDTLLFWGPSLHIAIPQAKDHYCLHR